LALCFCLSKHSKICIAKIFNEKGTVAIVLCMSVNGFAKCPGSAAGLNYQAVARDQSGAILSAHSIGLRVGIVGDSANGMLIYSETFTAITNQFGLFTVNVGTGTPVSGNFSTINWARVKCG